MSLFGSAVYVIAFVGSVWALILIILGRATPLVYLAAAVFFGLGALYDVVDGDALWAAVGGAVTAWCASRASATWNDPTAWRCKR